MKKFISLFVVILLVLSMSVPVFASSTGNVDKVSFTPEEFVQLIRNNYVIYDIAFGGGSPTNSVSVSGSSVVFTSFDTTSHTFNGVTFQVSIFSKDQGELVDGLCGISCNISCEFSYVIQNASYPNGQQFYLNPTSILVVPSRIDGFLEPPTSLNVSSGKASCNVLFESNLIGIGFYSQTNSIQSTSVFNRIATIKLSDISLYLRSGSSADGTIEQALEDIKANQEIINDNITSSADKIIQNNNENTDKITQNNNENTEKITGSIDNNTDKLIESLDTPDSEMNQDITDFNNQIDANDKKLDDLADGMKIDVPDIEKELDLSIIDEALTNDHFNSLFLSLWDNANIIKIFVVSFITSIFGVILRGKRT